MITSQEALANYERVNALWRDNNQPIRATSNNSHVDFVVAKRLLRNLWRQEVGTKFPYKTIRQVTGRKNTWVYRGVLNINCNKGWADIVHLWSHWIDRRINRSLRPHSAEHSMIEYRCTKHFFDKSYMQASVDALSKPKEKKIRVNVVAQRYQRMLKRQKDWNKKLKLAQTHLAKVEKEIRKYERLHSEEKRTSKYLEN